jgi:hypothetical protein
MGSSETSESQQDTGKPSHKDKRFEELWGHLSSQLGELSVVVGEFREAIRQSDNRRVESLQGPVDQAFQSTQEAFKELQETYYSDRDTNPSRSV